MSLELNELKVRLTFISPMLGTKPADPDIYAKYIAGEAPTAESVEEEAQSVEGQASGMTVFSRDADGNPIIWDYMIKGFFKEAASMLGKVSSSKTKTVKAYKKIVDGLVHVFPRQIPLQNCGEIGVNARSLRSSGVSGERVAIARSEEIQAGAYCDITIKYFEPSHLPLIREWLDYGEFHGISQWRNAGYGQFTWTEVK